MIYKMVCVFDSKSKLYSSPAYFKTNGEAIRAFMEACKDDKTTVGRYPEDFTFFGIGEFDEETGAILSYDTLSTLARGVDFKA